MTADRSPTTSRMPRGPDGRFLAVHPGRGRAKSGKRDYRRPYAKTGIHAVQALVRARGLKALDQRTPAVRGLLEWRRDLIADLGGEAHLTAARRRLVDLAARTSLYIDVLDAWLLERPSLVIARRRTVYPVLLQRQQLVDSLVKALTTLGLDRRDPKRVRDVGEAIAGAEPVGDG